MNKLAIALSAALSLGLAASANAASADITFTGEILDATCAIGVGTGTSTAVPLRKVAIADLAGGVTARSTPFDLVAGGTAGGSCPDGDLKMVFSGASINTDGKLDNTSTGAADAKNVQLVLAHNGTELDLNTAEITGTVAAGTGTTTYKMEARYEQKGSTAVTKGAFTTAVKVDVFY
ncbi:fimbrial protein [Stenotrophomonas maltophilia]|uniref:fimbrial protein n=1 Tax=Stenotrophomonas maltophilia TaxID=40324 RepID=UPI0012B0DF05|nr:fimbrial protein [Stenotrophomonas maltophilia]QGL67986.1 type 1 fimbrial protein [Stenotrophomonas maltophilia]